MKSKTWKQDLEAKTWKSKSWQAWHCARLQLCE